MKYPCGLIRDLLPLYHDKACGEESNQAVQEHFDECLECRQYYATMNEADTVEGLVYDEEIEQKKAESLKQMQQKMKKKEKKIVIIAVVGALLISAVVYILIICLIIGLLIASFESAEIEVYTDISEYEKYIGVNAEDMFQNKWGMDETIFPASITGDMNVEDYKMVYYNPWDAQYLSYLTVQYEAEDYAAEVERLKAYESTEYIGYYSVTGQPEGYTLLAMHADDYQGFVYALTDNEDTVIYVELIFCNYFMDLDYTEYIPKEYLLEGFDATLGNPYEEQKMKKDPQALENIVEQYEEDLNLK